LPLLFGGSLLPCGRGQQFRPQAWIRIAEYAVELCLRVAMGQSAAQCADHDFLRESVMMKREAGEPGVGIVAAGMPAENG